MGRPPVKRERAMIKAKLTAEAKFDKSPIGREVWLREQAEKLIDKIDPIELLAAIGGMFIVYDLIKNTQEMLVVASSRLGWAGYSPIFTIIIDMFGGFDLTAEQKAEIEKIRTSTDIGLYIQSFVISYAMIRHSGQIISGVGNMTSFVAGFLGMKAV